MVMVLSAASRMVWPSGGDLASSNMARLPFAPVRFSITTVQPRVSCRYCPTSRAEMSGAPPGGMVTSNLMGREGKVGSAPAAELASAASVRNARPHAFGLMLPLRDWNRSFTIMAKARPNTRLNMRARCRAWSRLTLQPGMVMLHQPAARRFEVSMTVAANSVRNFKTKSGTRIIELLVSLGFRSCVSEYAGNDARTAEAGH